ncbi:MAG: ABC transporter ATP-binding protein [Methanosarcina thermophila]|jgi:peptide/nickel transport system ATP-binding protein|uniref:Oligopeptide transport ATP-binding protein OppF n=1 Tax=Methanosarcina thermophila CHTI-55 TaxID=1434121 RepID=A0A0E3NBL5_METTE|nr:ABC transporter ATP-binding protein [Methanosarcina thermophila]AKB14738.1 Oligopeptide transport ATP-binding protein OppF [Methanosarcina thermophila CHTI-55]NLU57392.1 ABC transporter ATP-binding protein [Methanosarcina thermophila]
MIEGRGLTKIFTPVSGKNRIVAVDNVNIRIKAGETLTLVGESGCGKSTLSRLLLLLIPPTRGEIFFEGQRLTGLKEKDLRHIRKKIQIVPQQPESSLNPRWKIADSICEPFRIHPETLRGRQIEEELKRLLKLVGLEPEQATRYPHQLSGGELQRAVIARAIALKPALLICDEPTSMLDVSTQASIVHLLKTLQQNLGCALLFITHDQGLARVIGDRTAVMFAGQIVEEGYGVFDRPYHPFTRKITSPYYSGSLSALEPQGTKVPGSCVYYQFCPERTEKCLHRPEMRKYKDRRVCCHNVSPS